MSDKNLPEYLTAGRMDYDNGLSICIYLPYNCDVDEVRCSYSHQTDIQELWFFVNIGEKQYSFLVDSLDMVVSPNKIKVELNKTFYTLLVLFPIERPTFPVEQLEIKYSQ